MPGCTPICCFIAGTKLASDTRTEYCSGGSEANPNIPRSLLIACPITRS